MGFHKRFISTDQVVDIFKQSGIEGVVEWYTKGVDALITEGQLAMDVSDVIYTDQLTSAEKDEEIDRLITAEILRKGNNEKEEKAIITG